MIYKVKISDILRNKHSAVPILKSLACRSIQMPQVSQYLGNKPYAQRALGAVNMIGAAAYVPQGYTYVDCLLNTGSFRQMRHCSYQDFHSSDDIHSNGSIAVASIHRSMDELIIDNMDSMPDKYFTLVSKGMRGLRALYVDRDRKEIQKILAYLETGSNWQELAHLARVFHSVLSEEQLEYYSSK